MSGAADGLESANNYPLIRKCDMPDEMRVEAVEAVVEAIEKHAGDPEAICKLLKETLDKRFGSSWHVIFGESYGFDVTHELKNLLYLYLQNYAILIFKRV